MVLITKEQVHRKEASQILRQIFLNNSIEGPYKSLISNSVNQYVKQRINRYQLMQDLIRFKMAHRRYETALTFYFEKTCIYNKIMPIPENKVNMTPMIMEHFGGKINAYISNLYLKITDLEKDYQQCVEVEKIKLRRQKFLDNLIDKMCQHPDFQYLPGNINMYFGKYFDMYLNHKEFTTPFFLKMLEEKHNDIMKSIDHTFRRKMIRKKRI